MSVNHFAYDAAGLSLTRQCEGCKLTAYKDQVGVWTIGYGHTGPDVVEGLTITEERASQLLEADIASAAACANRCVTVPLSQCQFDALVDFIFNLGPGAFQSSSLLKHLNSGDFEAAAAEFLKWDHAGGKVVAGLLQRRQQEDALFCSSQSQTESA